MPATPVKINAAINIMMEPIRNKAQARKIALTGTRGLGLRNYNITIFNSFNNNMALLLMDAISYFVRK